MRLNESFKQNKDWKSNTSLMERKVDELSEENGVLSSQVRTSSSFVKWDHVKNELHDIHETYIKCTAFKVVKIS